MNIIQTDIFLRHTADLCLISRTLILHSGQALRLDPFTVIRLAPPMSDAGDQLKRPYQRSRIASEKPRKAACDVTISRLTPMPS